MPSKFPSDEQKAVIESTGSALVVAGPGTGKTRTAIAHAQHSLKSLARPSTQKVMFLSFSNAAIVRLMQSAKMNLTTAEKSLLRFQTYHSFAFEILRNYGRFVGVTSPIRVADTLERILLGLELGWALDDVQTEAKFLRLAKERGVVTFNHMIPLTISLLRKSPEIRSLISRKYPVIIVDEFQDTSQEQWDLLRLIGEKPDVVVFGDPNQIIYAGLHKATAKRIDEFKKWKQVSETPFTPTNFRCGSAEILDFAQCILQAKPYKPSENGDVQYIPVKYRAQLRVYLALIWRSIRDQVGKNESVAFLTPSNKLAEEVSVSLRNPPADARVSFPVYAPIVSDETANDSVRLSFTAFKEYTMSPGDRTERNLILSLLALRLAWKGPKISKGEYELLKKSLNAQLSTPGAGFHKIQSDMQVLSADKIMVDFVKALSKLPKFDQVAARISDHGLRDLTRRTSDMQLNLFVEDRINRRPKGLYGFSDGHGLTQVMTYHKAKGREFDFVVLISDPRQESNQSSIEEKRRLHYVCATRAKKWLGVIYYSDGTGEALKPVVN
jgi:superfamily I DNA/RNA helicase